MATYTHNEVVGSPATPWFDLNIGPVLTGSASEIVLSNSDGTRTRLFSATNDFVYDSINDTLTGTITSMTRTDVAGGTVYETVTSLSLSAASLYATTDNNGATALIFANVDTLAGWSGDDTLVGRASGDSFNGGSGGTDFASYQFASTGLVVDLTTPANNTDEAIGDTYTSIEGIIGSAQDDTLRGDAGNNILRGGDGVDFLRGRGGADSLDGGNGIDFADYGGSGSASVLANLANSAANTGSAAGDVYTSIEGLSGSIVNDTLIGDSGNNFLRGNAGADSLDGGAGVDLADYRSSTSAILVSLATPGSNTGDAIGDTYTSIEGIIGSAQDDTLIGDSGSNFLRGGLGADSLDGGNGNDYADYRNSASALLVSLAAPGSNTGEAVGDVYTSIENIQGSNFNDTLIGDSGGNSIMGGTGADSMDGGAGFDFAEYLTATSAVLVNLANNAANTGDAAGDTLVGFEGVRGSRFNDTLIGDANGNQLYGGVGADSLSGGGGNDSADYRGANSAVLASLLTPASNTGDAAGDIYTSIENLRGSDFNDTLIGDNGNNSLRGGIGADSMDGGNGFDTAEYFNATSAVLVNLGNTAANTGEAAGDIYTSIESIAGSTFNDTLIGSAGNNNLSGGAGADSLDGGAGFDFATYGGSATGLIVNLGNTAANTGEAIGDTYTSIEAVSGSNFNDTLVGDGNGNFLSGSGGADSLDGGAGSDYASYGGFVGLVVNLGNTAANTGEAIGDTYTSIEGLSGTGFNDTLVGDANDNLLRGNAGADALDGGSGGRDFADYLGSGTGLVVNLANTAANTGDAIGDTYTAIDGIQGSGLNDTLVGDGNDNYLRGAAGGDSLNGGGGNDWADYTPSPGGVLADLGNAAANTGTAAGDTYTSIENLLGSGFSDTLVGDGGNNILDGASGNDSLTGGLGADQLFGGIGADTLTADSLDTVVDGGSEIDTVNLTGAGVVFNLGFRNIEIANGTAGGDQIDGSVGTTGTLTLNGLGGNDQLTGGAAGDSISGGDGDDGLFGNGGADTISGGIGVDFINAGDGTDLINAGDDNDAIFGGDANDTINGDAGNDGAFAQGGNDLMNGGTGRDYLVGDSNLISDVGIIGTDTLSGDSDNDTLIGGYLSDSLNGGIGNDALYGDFDDVNAASNPGAADTLIGDAGTDFMAGGGGNDVLDGGADSDTLIGGSENDTMNGGEGSDSYYGKDGVDTFVFSDNWGTDGVWDFADGSEIFDLTAVTGLTSFAQLTITDQSVPGLNYADVAFGANHIFVVGVAAAQLTALDFNL